MTRSGSDPLRRIEDLAAEAGTTVRNIRLYQEKGLLPPPVRRGRSALYGPEHRRRLRLVLRLLDRGYTFATIGELFAAERHGMSLTELLDLESGAAVRRMGKGRRRYSRSDAEVLAGFAMPEQLVGLGEEIGLVGGRGSTDDFFADAHMYRLFAELVELGVDRQGIERIGELILEGQRTAAEASDVVVAALRSAGADQAEIAARVDTLLPRAGGAVRLIFLSAVTSRLIDLHGLTGT